MSANACPSIRNEFETVPPIESASGEQLPGTDRRCQWFIAWTIPPVVICGWMALTVLGIISLPPQGPVGISGACGIVAILLLVTATATDLRTLKIRNWTTIPAFVFVVMLNLIQSASSLVPGINSSALIGGVGMEVSLLGSLLCFSGMFTLHLLFGGGAGDIKLMTVIGALVGWQVAACVWLTAMLSGAVWALGFAATRLGKVGCLYLLTLVGQRVTVSQSGGEWLKETLQFQMPMAPHFTLGYVLIVVFQLNGQIIKALGLPF